MCFLTQSINNVRETQTSEHILMVIQQISYSIAAGTIVGR